VFTGWSGAASGTSNPVTIVMNSNKTLTANFSISGETTPSPSGMIGYANLSYYSLSVL
jgi:uncharacterized repeat protein (TIGR02543 family)